MPSSLSVGLHERVAAFASSGVSCREARVPLRGRRRKCQPSGGGHASHRVEAQAGLILATCRQPPAILLRELRDRVAERDMQTSTSGLSCVLARHGISRRKRRRLPPGRAGRM